MCKCIIFSGSSECTDQNFLVKKVASSFLSFVTSVILFEGLDRWNKVRQNFYVSQ